MTEALPAPAPRAERTDTAATEGSSVSAIRTTAEEYASSASSSSMPPSQHRAGRSWSSSPRAHRPRWAPVTFRRSARERRAVRPEELAQLRRIQFGLLERGEVTAPRRLGGAHHVRGPLQPRPRGANEVAREDRESGRAPRRGATAARRGSSSSRCTSAWTTRSCRVTQNWVRSVRISSFVKHRSMSPSQSLQLRSFSTIHAAKPDGRVGQREGQRSAASCGASRRTRLRLRPRSPRHRARHALRARARTCRRRRTEARHPSDAPPRRDRGDRAPGTCSPRCRCHRRRWRTARSPSTRHELRPARGDVDRGERMRRTIGVAEAGHVGDDHVERVGRIAAVRARVGQQRDDLQISPERVGPAVVQQQRHHRCRVRSVARAWTTWMPRPPSVTRKCGRRPIASSWACQSKPSTQYSRQFAEVAQVGAERPARVLRCVRPPRRAQPSAQVVDHRGIGSRRVLLRCVLIATSCQQASRGVGRRSGDLSPAHSAHSRRRDLDEAVGAHRPRLRVDRTGCAATGGAALGSRGGSPRLDRRRRSLDHGQVRADSRTARSRRGDSDAGA